MPNRSSVKHSAISPAWSRFRHAGGVLSVFVFSLIFCGVSFSQPNDNSELTGELIKTVREGENFMMVFWISDVWVKADSKSTFRRSLTDFLRRYVVILAAKAKQRIGLTYLMEEQLRDSITLVDASGVMYNPLAEKSIESDLKLFLSMAKPIFAQMFGVFGEEMHPFVFRNQTLEGERIADATAPGSFAIQIGSTKVRWDLPLESLQEKKLCQICKRTLSGAFRYCPFDATELVQSSMSSSEAPPADFVEVEVEPVVTKNVNPRYPELAMQAGIEGRVWVKILVGKDGKPKQVVVLKSDAEILNDAAVEAGWQFLFTPAMMGGKPVSVWVSVPFNFRLVDKKKTE